MLYKNYDHKDSVKKIFGRDPQRVWRQNELTDNKLPVAK
jgi:hypothetical protein